MNDPYQSRQWDFIPVGTEPHLQQTWHRGRLFLGLDDTVPHHLHWRNSSLVKMIKLMKRTARWPYILSIPWKHPCFICTIKKLHTKGCYGCEINHPSKRQNACLCMLEDDCLQMNFEHFYVDLHQEWPPADQVAIRSVVIRYMPVQR